MTARKAPRTPVWPRPDELIRSPDLVRALNDFLPPPATFWWNMDGGGSVLTTGVSGSVHFPNITAYIEGWTLVSSDNTSGSIVVDIWKRPYSSSGVPTVADTITASAKPTISSAVKAQSATLTGWTTKINPGDVLTFNIDSVTSLSKVLLSFQVYR